MPKKRKRKTGSKKTLIETVASSSTEVSSVESEAITSENVSKKNSFVVKQITSDSSTENISELTPTNLEDKFTPRITSIKSISSEKPKKKSKGSPAEYKDTDKHETLATDDARGSFQKSSWKNFKKGTFRIIKKGSLYLTVIAFVTAIFIGIELYSDGRFYPRTTLGPIALGYKLPKDAEKDLQRVHDYIKNPLIFEYENREVKVSPEELGITFLADESLKTARKLEFTKTNVLNLAKGLLSEEKTPLQFNIDQEKLAKLLEKKFELQNLKPRNARFVFNDKKQLTIENEQEGKTIHREKLLSAIKENLQTLANTPIQVELISKKPQIVANQLEPQKEQFQKILKQPLTLTYENHKWKMNLIDHIDAITFVSQTTAQVKDLDMNLPVTINENELNSQDYQNFDVKPLIALDEEKIKPWLEKEIISQIKKPTQGVKIRTEETPENSKSEDSLSNSTQTKSIKENTPSISSQQKIDKKKKIIIEGKGQNGLSVPEKRLISHINLALNNGASTVQIPVQEEKAPVEISPDLQELGIKNLLGTGHSSFYGSSANRKFNIDLSIKKYNGLIIKPGEEFSFNEVLGEVDTAHGFKLEKVIKKDKAEYEPGGGVCQVSSTVYRAALFAGLPIVERSPHSWKVNYYGQVLGHGLDATIYPGSKDFRFKNDTPANILIQAYTDDYHAYFKFYGTDDGRKISLEGPHGGGLSYTWYRTLIKDGETKKETIISRYKPIPVQTPTPPKPANSTTTASNPKPMAEKPTNNPGSLF